MKPRADAIGVAGEEELARAGVVLVVVDRPAGCSDREAFTELVREQGDEVDVRVLGRVFAWADQHELRDSWEPKSAEGDAWVPVMKRIEWEPTPKLSAAAKDSSASPRESRVVTSSSYPETKTFKLELEGTHTSRDHWPPDRTIQEPESVS